MTLAWRRVLLYLSIAIMELCWIYLFLALLSGAVSRVDFAIAGPIIAYPAAFTANLLLHRLKLHRFSPPCYRLGPLGHHNVINNKTYFIPRLVMGRYGLVIGVTPGRQPDFYGLSIPNYLSLSGRQSYGGSGAVSPDLT